MIVRIHKTKDRRKIIAICDKEIIGKRFEEKERQLDLSSDFYKRELMSKEELEKQIKNAYVLNIVGKKSVDFCLSKKLISKENIIYIKKIPYAQCMIL